MPKITLTGHPIAFAVLVILFACDRQVDTDYQGDPLLRVSGSVTIPEGLEGRDLVPVIQFDGWLKNSLTDDGFMYVKGDDYLYSILMDVGVTGEFPAKFTLEIFDPPPKEAIYQQLVVLPDRREPVYAYGYIAAVDRLHPPKTINRVFEPDSGNSFDSCHKAAIAANQSEQKIDQCSYSWLSVTCPFDSNNPRYPVREDARSEACSWQNVNCTMNSISIYDKCAVADSGGNQSLRTAGYSVNIVIAYFPEPVPADTMVAFYFNRGDAISSGYHLYRMRTDPFMKCMAQKVLGEAVECSDKQALGYCEYQEQSYTDAIDRFNQEHGTQYTTENMPPPDPDLSYQFELTYMKVMKEYGCAYYPDVESIGDFSTVPISIELGANGPRRLE